MKKTGIRAVIPLLIIISLVMAFFYFAGDLLIYPLGSWRSTPSAGEKESRPAPLIIAHRGLSAEAPESTRAAYALALEGGISVLEGDVQRSLDGRLFLFHDSDFSRVTDVEERFPRRREEPVGSFTWEEIDQLRILHHPGQGILPLGELLDLAEEADQPVTLYLETKSPALYPGIEGDLVSLLQERGWKGRSPQENTLNQKNVILQSFSAESLSRLKELAPGIERTLLLSGKLIYLPRQRRAALRRAAEIADAVGPHKMLCTPALVSRFRRSGLAIHAYTVNDSEEARKLWERGVSGIFTDRAREMTQAFQQGF